MATRIGSYNEDAFNAVKAMTKANAAVSQASERISSGLRVNHAADDPGGLALATRLQAQVSSNSKVMDNLYQAVAVTQIVDDSLSQINDLLTKLVHGDTIPPIVRTRFREKLMPLLTI